MDETIVQDSEQLHSFYLAGADRDLLDHLGRAMAHTQRLANIGMLATGIAYELGSPLSIIASACSNLLNELQENELDREALARHIALIEENAFRSAHTVEVLRDYVYDAQPRMAVTTITAILHDALTLVQHQFLVQGGVEIEVELSDQLGSVVCDHNRITQVLVNLLSNAYYAMKPQGGMIKISFWSVPPAQFGGNGNGRYATNASGKFAFAVTDSGSGLAPEAAEQIFEPFFTTRAAGEGLGLGLFIAREIVLQHNGHIWVENNPRPTSGVTSTVILPIRP